MYSNRSLARAYTYIEKTQVKSAFTRLLFDRIKSGIWISAIYLSTLVMGNMRLQEVVAYIYYMIECKNSIVIKYQAEKENYPSGIVTSYQVSDEGIRRP